MGMLNQVKKNGNDLVCKIVVWYKGFDSDRSADPVSKEVGPQSDSAHQCLIEEKDR
jgi:hypothetical protein